MIQSLDEFTKFLKICRKQGVSDVTFDGVTVKFGDLPDKSKNESEDAAETDLSGLPMGLTPEQLMMYSVGRPET